MSITRVDARGLRCPWPVLRLARAMRETDKVEILADDPAAPAEIKALAEVQGWTIRAISGGFQVGAFEK
ncbi:sulfurtransferase TusA family protein [Sphingomonas sp. MMS24-J13]|uniref:sulfurtransferase TusA family protein n=1 Tax=Sphingomonas sp. MMS24-J13 TaxID=3238686 RepID=UPI00384DC504